MAKIAYDDKVNIVNQPVPDVNKVTAEDMNEIKTSVNINVDDIDANSVEIATKAELNGDGGEVFAVDTAVSPADAVNKQQFDAAIDALSGSLVPQGNWNADTNTPDITTTTETGYYWIVSVAGNTDLGGITDWELNDWAIKTDTGWAKIDNSESVISVAGKTGVVTLDIADITSLQSSLDDKANLAGGNTFDGIQNLTDHINIGNFTGGTRPLNVFRATDGSVATLQTYVDGSNFFGFYIDTNLTTKIVKFNASGSSSGGYEWFSGATKRMSLGTSGILTLFSASGLPLRIKNSSSGTGIQFTDSGGSTDLQWVFGTGYTLLDDVDVAGDITANNVIGNGALITDIDTANITDFNTDVSAIITADVDKAFVDALNVDADLLDGKDSADFVDITTAQTITGLKTFDNEIRLEYESSFGGISYISFRNKTGGAITKPIEYSVSGLKFVEDVNFDEEVICAKTIETGGYTVATLPVGSQGARAYVTDSSVAMASNYGAVVAGGGANVAPVFYDGTNWRIG